MKFDYLSLFFSIFRWAYLLRLIPITFCTHQDRIALVGEKTKQLQTVSCTEYVWFMREMRLTILRHGVIIDILNFTKPRIIDTKKDINMRRVSAK